MAIIGNYLLSKGKEFAVNQATGYVKGKLLEAAKKKAGEAFFGPNVAGVSNDRDFRGLKMYEETKPGRFLSFFFGSSVIDTRELDLKLRDQAIQSFELQSHLSSITSDVKRNEDGEQELADKNLPKDLVVVTGDETEEGQFKKFSELSPQQKTAILKKDGNPQPTETSPEVPGQAPMTGNDAIVKENLNKPITTEDFENIVTWEEKGKPKAKNKGYVRFVKVKDAKGNLAGVKLEKVGNKCDWCMSWRINVTKEHNRQMRLLFADTLLADFGGFDGIEGVDENTKFGTVLKSQLESIRKAILNSTNAGDLLARTTIRKCIEDYKALFTDGPMKTRIIQSFMEACLGQCDFTLAGPNPSVEAFVNAYGRYAKPGFQTVGELLSRFNDVKDGKSLRKAMEEVAEAFGQMNEAWQVDKSANTFLGNVAANVTTANDGIPQGKALDRLKKAIVRRMGDHTDVKANDYTAVNAFFDKAYPLFLRSARATWATNESDPNRNANFRATLSLDNLVETVKDFANELRTVEGDIEKLEKENASPIKLIIGIKEKEFKAAEEEMGLLKKSGRDDDKLDAKVADLRNQIKYLTDIMNKANGENALMSADLRTKIENLDLGIKKLGQKIEESKDKLKNPPEVAKKPEDLALKRFTTMIAEASKQVVSADFAKNFVLDRYLKERFPNLASEQDLWQGEKKLDDFFGRFNGLQNDFSKSILDLEAKIKKSNEEFEKKIQAAIAANNKDKNDMAPAQMFTDLADFLMYDSGLGKLESDDSKAINENYNPSLIQYNNRMDAQKTFLHTFMEKAVSLAVERKAAGTSSMEKSLEGYKETSAKLIDLLGKLFDKLKTDKNFGGLKSYYRNVRTYSFQNAQRVGKDRVDTLKAKYREGLREKLHLKLIEPFLEDVSSLLAEKPDQFEKLAGVRLDMRVKEFVSSFRQSLEQQFYEDELRLKTNTADDKIALQKAVTGERTKDPDTGYTNPVLVPAAFETALKKFNVVGVLNGDVPLGNKTYELPALLVGNRMNIAGYINAHAHAVWRGQVVANAPGKAAFYFVDVIKDWFKDFFGVSSESRFTDIDEGWRQDITEKFNLAFQKYVKGCISFENRLVDCFRSEVSKALVEGKDVRFAGVGDLAKRKQLLEDVLGGYTTEIEGIIKRYAETPEAFAGLSSANFASLVRDHLGLTRHGGETDVTKTSGYAKLKAMLDKTVTYRQDLILGYINKGYSSKEGEKPTLLANDISNRVLARIEAKDSTYAGISDLLKSKGLSRPASLQFASKLLGKVAEYAAGFALKNPVDTFDPDYEVFVEKLVDKALSVLGKVQGSVANIEKEFIVPLDSSLDGLNAFESWAQTRAVNEKDAVLDKFVDLLFTQADVGSQKKTAEFAKLVSGLCKQQTQGFANYVENLKKFKTELSENIYGVVDAKFTERTKDGRFRLMNHGITSPAALRFEEDVANVRSLVPNLISELGKKTLETSTATSFETAVLKQDVAQQLFERQDKLIADYEKLLDENSLNFSAGGIEDGLSQQGIDGTSFPNRKIFESVVQSLRTDPAVADEYEKLQIAAIDKGRTTGANGIVQGEQKGVKTFEQDVKTFWADMTAHFKLQYSILDAQERVRNEIEEQKGQVANLAKENNWKKEDVDRFVARSVAGLEKTLTDLGTKYARFRSGSDVKLDELALDNVKPDLAGDVKRAFEAQTWLKANLDKITDRVANIYPKALRHTVGEGKNVEGMVVSNLDRVKDMIAEGLENGVLTKGSGKEWDDFLAKVQNDRNPAWIEDIEASLVTNLNEMSSKTELAEQFDRLDIEIQKDVDVVRQNFDKLVLKWCMPHASSTHKGGSGISGSYQYENLIGKGDPKKDGVGNEKYVNANTVFKVVLENYQTIVEAAKAKKNLPTLDEVKALVSSYHKAIGGETLTQLAGKLKDRGVRHGSDNNMVYDRGLISASAKNGEDFAKDALEKLSLEVTGRSVKGAGNDFGVGKETGKKYDDNQKDKIRNFFGAFVSLVTSGQDPLKKARI